MCGTLMLQIMNVFRIKKPKGLANIGRKSLTVNGINIWQGS